MYFIKHMFRFISCVYLYFKLNGLYGINYSLLSQYLSFFLSVFFLFFLFFLSIFFLSFRYKLDLKTLLTTFSKFAKLVFKECKEKYEHQKKEERNQTFIFNCCLCVSMMNYFKLSTECKKKIKKSKECKHILSAEHHASLSYQPLHSPAGCGHQSLLLLLCCCDRHRLCVSCI